MEQEKKKISVYMPTEVIKICDTDLELSTAGSRNQFISDAILFYHAYLNKEITNSVLTPAFESVVEAKVHLSEYRISQIIFKLAVETASLMNILAGAFELDDSKVRAMKHRVINEVKALNGYINLEDIIRYQNEESDEI
ncbi:MAG: hypothetical protein IJ766_09160 [Clostridia bacterium]|nr:hypothetical protein [Clostridia bacterium]